MNGDTLPDALARRGVPLPLELARRDAVTDTDPDVDKVSVCVARAERDTRDAVAEPLTSGLAEELGEPDARGDAVEDAVALNAADARALGESEKVALGRVDKDVDPDVRGD
jgi:hypothetical protein